MIVLRVIGWLMIGAALVCAGSEIVASLQDGRWTPLTAGEIWFRLHPFSLNLSQAVVK